MPKIFEYLGIILFFYSNEHEPIHVHATYGSLESKAEFFILDGKITEIKIRPVQNRKPLKGPKLKDFEIFWKVTPTKLSKNGLIISFLKRKLHLKEYQRKSHEN